MLFNQQTMYLLVLAHHLGVTTDRCSTHSLLLSCLLRHGIIGFPVFYLVLQGCEGCLCTYTVLNSPEEKSLAGTSPEIIMAINSSTWFLYQRNLP
jgi:hypothetical protein